MCRAILEETSFASLWLYQLRRLLQSLLNVAEDGVLAREAEESVELPS